MLTGSFHYSCDGIVVFADLVGRYSRHGRRDKKLMLRRGCTERLGQVNFEYLFDTTEIPQMRYCFAANPSTHLAWIDVQLPG